MKNPTYMPLNLLDLCQCSKIRLNTTHIHLLSQNHSTLLVATKMALQSLPDTAAVQAGILPFVATAGPRKLAMRVSHLKHIF
jgi:hypothetical protein